jgi:hypothetical protein
MFAPIAPLFMRDRLKNIVFPLPAPNLPVFLLADSIAVPRAYRATFFIASCPSFAGWRAYYATPTSSNEAIEGKTIAALHDSNAPIAPPWRGYTTLHAYRATLVRLSRHRICAYHATGYAPITPPYG